MAEEHAYNTITPENAGLESGGITEYSHTSVNQASENIMDQVKREFIMGDEGDSDRSTEETTYDTEEEGGDLRKSSDIPKGIIERTFLPEEITDSVNENLKLNSDILEYMTINSSPAEQITRLFDVVNGDFGRNNVFPPEENHSEAFQVTSNPPVIIGPNDMSAVSSRYISAPSASCHDICKAGHKHHLEDPKRCVSGIIKVARPLTRVTSVAIPPSMSKTKKKALRCSSLPGLIIEKKPHMHFENMNDSRKESNRLKLKCIQGEIKPPLGSTSGHSSSKSKSDIQAGKKMGVSSPKSLKDSSQAVKEIKTRKEAGSHSRATKEKAKDPMNSPVIPNMPLTPKRSPVMKNRIYKNPQSFSQSKNQSNSEEAKSKGSVDVPEKTLHMIEPSSEKKPATRASKVTSSSKSLQNVEEAKKPMGSPCSPRTPGPLKGSPSAKARLNKNPKRSHSKNRNDSEEAKITGSVDVPEKTLYMIEPNSEKKPSKRTSLSASSSKRSPITRSASHASKKEGPRDNQKGIEIDHLYPSSASASISTVSPAQEPNEPQGEDQQDSESTVDSTTMCKRTGTCHPEEKGDSSRLVKFRKGSEVALEVSDASSKILQFREGSILDDDQNAKNEAVCLRETEVAGNEPHDVKAESPRVLLKHQEAVEKKNNVDLNNVIEETASKLVKARKSKVQALVGAFETLMSLGDGKSMVKTTVS